MSNHVELGEFNPALEAMSTVTIHGRAVDGLNGQILNDFKLRIDRDEYFKDRLITVIKAYRKHIEGKQ